MMSNDSFCPGLEEGWMICSLCNKQLAGLCTVLSHFESKRHQQAMGWYGHEGDDALRPRLALPEPAWSPAPASGGGWNPPAPQMARETPLPPAPPPTQGTTQTAFTPPAFPSSMFKSSMPEPPPSSTTYAPRRGGPPAPAVDNSYPSWAPPPPVSRPAGTHDIAPPLPPGRPAGPRPPPGPRPPGGTAPSNAAPPPPSASPWASGTGISQPPPPPPEEEEEHPPPPVDEEDDDEPDFAPPAGPPTLASEGCRLSAPLGSGSAGPSKVVRHQQVALAYNGAEVNDQGEPEGGYLPLMVGQQVTLMSEHQPGHDANQYPKYAYARVTDAAGIVSAGWVPLACLRPVTN